MSPKPEALEVIHENIPEPLKALDRWVVWRYENRKGKWAKPPRQTNDRYASSDDPHTWTSYNEAYGAYLLGKFDGIGIVLPDGLVGIDLDDSVAENGKLTEQAAMVASMIPTYCEVSPSGTGIKMVAAGQLNAKLAKTNHFKGVELYDGGDTNRYFTITGQIQGEPKPITGNRDGLFALQAMITEPLSDKTNITEDPEKASKARDLLPHISKDRADNYDDWLKVGMALSWCDKSDEMLEAWLEWSQASDKYDEDIARAKWESFRREDGRLLTLGFLERLAKEDGYDPNKYQTGFVDASELWDKRIERKWLIDNFLVENEPMIIGGASKSLKTSIALEMAISIVSGTKFLDTFPVDHRAPVMFISGESGESTLRDNLVNMAQAKGLSKEDVKGLKFGFKLPKLDDPKTVDDLIEELRDNSINILFVDPLYRSLRVGDGASNVYTMGAQLELIAEKIHKAGISVILLHHFRKQGKSYSECPELEDLSQAGIAEFGRQFLLLKRREEYLQDGKHNLWFTWGGSAGHQGSRILEVYTGTIENGLTWQTTLRTRAEVEATKKENKEVSESMECEELRAKVLEIIGENPGLSTAEISRQVGGKKATLLDVLEGISESMEAHSKPGPRGAKLWFINL